MSKRLATILPKSGNNTRPKNVKKKPATPIVTSTPSNKLLAIVSDPSNYKIPEKFLNTSKPKPRVLKSCTRCRKHKTKCNYVDSAPNPCASCSKKNATCEFEVIMPTKRSNMIKSLRKSVSDLRVLVDQAVQREVLLKQLCQDKGIDVPGLIDIQSLGYSQSQDEMYDFEDDEDDYDYDEEEEENYEDDDDPELTTISPTLLHNGMTTPITSPNSLTPPESSYTHGFKDSVFLNLDHLDSSSVVESSSKSREILTPQADARARARASKSPIVKKEDFVPDDATEDPKNLHIPSLFGRDADDDEKLKDTVERLVNTDTIDISRSHNDNLKALNSLLDAMGTN